MLGFTVVPLDLDDRDLVHARRAVECINRVQKVFVLDLRESRIIAAGESLPWPLEVPLASDDNPNLIGISSRAFFDNWFSHTRRGLSVISTADWSDLFAPPGLSSYLMLEIALGIYCQLADTNDHCLDPHEPPIGCLLDWCMNKSEVSWRMRCGSLCSVHEGLLRAQGASRRAVTALQRILEMVRYTAFGRLDFDDIPKSSNVARVFIGSSGEAVEVAYGIQRGLERQCRDVECTVWTDGVFSISSNFLSALARRATETDFAILVAERDDIVTWRGETSPTPRDNVTFELGLFMGALGTDRTFLVCPEEAPRLPSDLNGFVHARYRRRTDGNIDAAIRPMIHQLCAAITEAGPRDRWTFLVERTEQARTAT